MLATPWQLLIHADGISGCLDETAYEARTLNPARKKRTE
jgi:hypothetical protein